MARSRRRDDDERAEYDRLHAKYGGQSNGRGRGRDRDDDDEDDDDDEGGVFILSGRRADSFLDNLFGSGKSRGRRRDDDEDQDDADDDDEDQDADDDDEDQDDPPSTATGHRFFRSGRGRG